jgi:hypothetical protein
MIRIREGDAVTEVAAGGDDGARLLGPSRSPLEAPAAAGSPATAAADGSERR